MAAVAACGLLTFGAGTASAAEPPDIAQLVAAMQQEGQNAAEKAAFTGGGYRASLARAAETAAQAAAAAPVSAPAQEDPGETGGDEEPSEPAPVTQHSIHDENGYYVHNGSAYNSITKDGLWVGGTDENTGFHVDSDGNVTTTGSITVNRTGGAGSVTIDASTGKITGVAKGDINENSTDAVNGSQLYYAIQEAEGTTYAAGDGVVIADGSTTGEDKTISVKAGNGIEAGADGVAVKVNGNNLTVNENGVSLSETLSGLTSVATGTLTASGAVTAGSFSTTGSITGGSVTADGVTVDNGKITGLVTESITGDTDATNKKYVDDKVTTAIGELDIPEYTAGNGIEINEGKISAKAKENGNIVVDGDGISLAADVKGLTSIETGTLTASGAVTAGSFSTTGSITGGSVKVDDVTINGGKITGLDTDSIQNAEDAVNKEYVDNLAFNSGKTYTAGNGIAISEAGEISAKAKENGNIVVDENGISLAADVKDLTSVTASGAITAGSFAAGNVKINENSGGTITGLTNTEWTGTATNGRAATEDQLASVQSQIKDYTAGDGISIDDDSDEISVAYGDGLTTDRQGNLLVDAGDGLGFNEDDNSLEVVTGDGLTISRNGEVTAAVGNGLDFDSDGKIVVEVASGGNLTVDSNGISLNKELTGLTSISTGTLTASSGITVGGTEYISTDGLNAGNHVITNVADGQNNNDAVNYGQLSALQKDFTDLHDLAVTYDAANKATITLDGTGGTKITNVAAGDIFKADSTDAVNGGQLYATNQIVGNGKWNTGSNYLTGDVENLTDAANALDSAIGNNRYTGDNVLNANTDKTYTSVTAAIGTLDSNIGNLKFSGKNVLAEGKAASVTAALTTLDEKIGPMSWESTTFLRNQGNLSGAAQLLDNNLSQTLQLIGVKTMEDAEGNIIPNPNIDWTGFHYATGEAGSSSTTIVGVMRSLDSQLFNLTGRVDALDGGGTQSLSAFSKMSAANVNALSALSNMDTKTAETLASMSSEQVETLAAKAPAAAPAAPAPGDPTATSTRPGPDGESETGDTGDAYEVKQDLHVTGDTTLDGTLTVDGAGTFNDGLTVNTKTEGGTALTVNGGASINGTLNMNGNKITGVADGEISETSTDAVNGSQLWGVQQDIENNASAIASLGGQVSRLDNRIDRVGAGAAALAALHPLDYDPEVKWDFTAGYGNYRGANAVSVGAFYRPNEDVMFSVGGSMGGGENMVNAGVSFKLGSGSGLTTSRTAMARELAAMKDTVAAQNAQIEAQAKQIEELTALVAQLAAEKAGAPEEKKA